jgi:RimJ/RimL family protein N-acetyltransferase
MRALGEAPYAFGTTVAEASSWPAERWEQQVAEIPTFIAVAGDVDVGVVRCIAHPDVRDARELIGMWVDPQSRRRHVGAALIHAASTWAVADGAQTLVLDVVEDNAGAIAFYSSLGFERFDGVSFGVRAPGELRMVRASADRRRAMALPTEIHTARLLLRPFEAGDVEDALAYRNDAEFARFLPHIPQPFTRADAEAFVALNTSEPWDRSPTFAVVLDGAVIGTVNLEVDAAQREAMLGYAIARAWWGRGIATEAARAAMAWAGETFDLVRLWASTDAQNLRSFRVMEKLGMEREAVRVGDHLGRGGELVDEVVYGVSIRR